jgi:hypothetical protein
MEDRRSVRIGQRAGFLRECLPFAAEALNGGDIDVRCRLALLHEAPSLRAM